MHAYKDLTVGDLLSTLAGDLPHREALVYPDRDLRLSFQELEAHTRKLARGLMAIGIQAGDRVAVWGPNLPEWIYLQFALAKVGAVLVTVNTSLEESELEFLLSQSQARAIFCAQGFRNLDYVQTVENLKSKLPHLEIRGVLEGPARFDFITLETVEGRSVEVEQSELEACQSAVTLDDVINMQYTSGTTGFPKGVMLTSRNIVNNAYWIGEGLGYTVEDRLCAPVPFFHCFGCVIAVLGAYTHGSCLVPLLTFDPLQVLEFVSQERCTAIYGVPTMFLAVLEHPRFKEFDLTSLRTGVMAGSLCPEALMLRVIHEMHVSEITIAYGLTETSPAITLTSRDDTVARRTQTVGQVLPQVKVKIMDPESGRELGIGEPGELCTRGYLVMKGYYNNPEATAYAIDDEGWLRTGDQATIDEEGYVRITGRIKDLIIRGGENISPKEVEDVLREHPAILDLCVYGVPHPKFGEEVAAAIRLREGYQQLEREQLIAHAQGRLARFKVPRELVFVEEFPLTASGKIQRFRLQETHPVRSS